MYRSLAALSFFSTALAAPAQPPEANSIYDFIVVGGGSSGLVVANRLSEDPTVSVAIIEAGDSVFNNTNVTDVAGYSKAFGTAIDYAYQSEPQLYAGNVSQTLRAGKALGGTSTINGMVYMRAETSQIDAWSRVGNNITWDSLLPYYMKSEYFEAPISSQIADGASFNASVHGFEGPLSVGWPAEMIGNNFSDILNTTFDAAGLDWNSDANDGHMRGYSVYQKTVNTAQNVRQDAARAYYFPIADRPNVDLYLNSFAERLTWEGVSHEDKPFANGVVVRGASGTKQTLNARKEIILSAGALVSPVILERSGVGNPAILSKHNISVVVSNPFVGENLQDQTTTDTAYAANQNFTGSGGYIGYYNVHDLFGNTTSTLSQSVKSSIPSWAEQVVKATGGTVNQTTIEKFFEIQHKMIFDDEVVIGEVIVNAPATGSSAIEYWGLMPFSRGNIHITSANASAINPNYFMLDFDIEQQVATARAAREIANTSPFSDLITSETTPGLDLVPANATEKVWGDWLKSTHRSNYHYIATAAMMSEELGGVVDDKHLVYGTANVRVVDASVVPFQVSGHLISTLYALAERAADQIKARYA